MDVGFRFYLILARMFDIDIKLAEYSRWLYQLKCYLIIIWTHDNNIKILNKFFLQFITISSYYWYFERLPVCIIKNHDKFLVKLDLLQQKAINFYRKNCQSIEIVKDDELQKVNFRVKNKVLLTNVTIMLEYFCQWILCPINWANDRFSPRP